MSRSETLRLVETYLCKARDMLQRPDEEVLRYLIHVAVSETRDLIDLENSETQMATRPECDRGERKKNPPVFFTYSPVIRPARPL